MLAMLFLVSMNNSINENTTLCYVAVHNFTSKFIFVLVTEKPVGILQIFSIQFN